MTAAVTGVQTDGEQGGETKVKAVDEVPPFGRREDESAAKDVDEEQN